MLTGGPSEVVAALGATGSTVGASTTNSAIPPAELRTTTTVTVLSPPGRQLNPNNPRGTGEAQDGPRQAHGPRAGLSFERQPGLEPGSTASVQELYPLSYCRAASHRVVEI